MRLLRSTPFLAALGAALLTGCGGSDDPAPPPPPTPQQQVKAAAQKLLDEHDAAVVCRSLVTRGFVQEVFAGDLQACAASDIAKAPTQGRQVVGDIEVGGRKASVEIVQRGGQHDGISGHYALVRDGRTWKLDAFEDDVIRTSLVLSADAAGKSDGGGAFTYAPLRACATKRMQAMPIDKARAFLFAGLQGSAKAKKLGNAILTQCPRELAGYVADRLATGINEDGKHSQAWVNCMRRQLTGLLLATGLAKHALSGNTDDVGTSALGGLAIGANRTCARKDAGAAA